MEPFVIDIQNACTTPIPIDFNTLQYWASLPLNSHRDTAELTLRLVDKKEIQALNYQYRQKNQPTNVLAFPVNLPKDIVLDHPLLGDVILCPTILEEEVQNTSKHLDAHWAHIVIHGVLHLLGYDHIKEDEAHCMQTIEIQLLNQLGFSNPYELEE